MNIETGKQQFCITKERDQVPETGVLNAVATLGLIGAIKIMESFPYLDLKNHEGIQAIKEDAKRILAMSMMAIEVKYFDRGWIVSEDHPMVDQLSLDEMKTAAAQVHNIY